MQNYHQNYRESIVAIILNKEKKILMCEHIWIDNAWQFPQGGVEKQETEKDTLKRELFEELGTKKFVFLSQMQEFIKYHFPYYLKSKYKSDGNEQKFFLLYFYGQDSEIKFDNQEKPEFKNFKWVDFKTPPREVIYFKKLSYLKALDYFKEDIEKFDYKKIEEKEFSSINL